MCIVFNFDSCIEGWLIIFYCLPLLGATLEDQLKICRVLDANERVISDAEKAAKKATQAAAGGTYTFVCEERVWETRYYFKWTRIRLNSFVDQWAKNQNRVTNGVNSYF